MCDTSSVTVDPVPDAAGMQVPRDVGLLLHPGLLAEATSLPPARRRAGAGIRGRHPGQADRQATPTRQEAEGRLQGDQAPQPHRPCVLGREPRLLRAQRHVSGPFAVVFPLL